ncbi:hypothetical protein BGW80DRAFT_360590 [Lactifluus volemus]|nr:hypothetical protein BGW80DRAFT_360590 [Lactifluus volemus]
MSVVFFGFLALPLSPFCPRAEGSRSHHVEVLGIRMVLAAPFGSACVAKPSNEGRINYGKAATRHFAPCSCASAVSAVASGLAPASPLSPLPPQYWHSHCRNAHHKFRARLLGKAGRAGTA